MIYPSAIEPWDGCMSGSVGSDPGYDPLAFAIEACHERGMELHAWMVTIPCFKTSAAKAMGSKSVLKNTRRSARSTTTRGISTPACRAQPTI